jgi:hypothetical protein
MKSEATKFGQFSDDVILFNYNLDCALCVLGGYTFNLNYNEAFAKKTLKNYVKTSVFTGTSNIYKNWDCTN